MICTKCGNPMRQTDKNTFSGRDIREYECTGCGHEDWEDRGTAMWQIFSDARKADEAEIAAGSAVSAEASPSQGTHPGRAPLASLWHRLACLFRKTK
ncbi:MAG: hypothetical protein WBP71_07210 [Terracidiphilus sp.]